MATGGGTGLTDENRNYVRAVLLVTNVGTSAVREVFDGIPMFVPGTLEGTLAAKIYSPEMRGVPKYLRDILFPAVPRVVALTSSDFDITMMVSLMDKLYTPLPPDVASWGVTRGLIQVIKDSRNTLVHSKDPSISDADFTTMWKDVSQAILNMVDVPSKPSYIQKMQDIKDILIGDKEFLEVVHLVKDTQTELKSKVDVVQASQTEFKDTQTEMKSKVDEIKTEFDELKENTVSNNKGNPDNVHDEKKMEEERDKKLKAFGVKLMKYLKEYYKKYRAGVQCNLLNPNSTMPLKDIYISLVWIKDYHQSDGVSVPLSHYREIFQRHTSEKEIEKLIRRILVQGKAGVGKTTFSNVLVYDWANENEPYLERFEAIFLLTMRNVKPEQSLVEIVKEQLLHRQPELVEGLKDYIENTEKCLFVFDGLDELGTERSQEIDDIIKGFYLNNACFLITSRPWLVQYLVLTDQGIDQLVRIEGFDPQNVEMFIKKFFAYMYKSNPDSEKVQDTSSKLFNEIVNRKLFDLVKIPLILNMFCLLFHFEKNLPNTLYKLYKEIRELLYEKGTKKSQQDINDLHEILMKLGKLAFEGLMKENDQLFFDYAEVIALVGEKAFEIGLISCEMMKGRMRNDTQVYFLHKSLQENLAAYYVGQEMEKKNEQPWEEMKKQMSTIEKLRNKALLLEFMSGESLVLYGKIQEYLDVMILEAFHNGYNSIKLLARNEDVIQILELHSKCLRHMQSTLHPEYIPDYISCDEELERFVQGSNSIPWIYLLGEEESNPFCFTERTVSLLSQIVDNNTRPCSVYIGENCKCDLKWIKLILEILKNHSNIKYKYITLSFNKYGDEGWEEVFQVLLGINELLGLELWGCDIPVTVLQSLGLMIKNNTNTLFVLNLAFNSCIRGDFHMITKEITTQDPLVLSMLNLTFSLHSFDSKSLSGFLQKTKNMKYLNFEWCKCEVSHDVIDLQKLRQLNIGGTVDQFTNRGINLKTILSNLHRLECLEKLSAWNCGINDSEIETFDVEKLNKIRVIDLIDNRMSDEVKSQIKEKCNRLRITCDV